MNERLQGLFSSPMFQMGVGLMNSNSLGQGLQRGLLLNATYQGMQGQHAARKAQAERELQQWQLEQQKMIQELQRNRVQFVAQQELAKLLQAGGDPNAIRAAMARSGQGNATAGMFEQPDKTLVKVPDPNSPTGFSYALRSAAVGGPAPGPSSTSFTFDPNTGQFQFNQGGAPVSKKTDTELEGDQVSALKMLDRLNSIAGSYRDTYLTYGGQLEAGTYALADKMGLSLSDAQKEMVRGKTQFTNEVKQLFNTYRKEVTGAAAAVQELRDLRDSLLNEKMSPTEFEAAYDQYVGLMHRQLVLADELRGQGFRGQTFLDALNRDYQLYKGAANLPDKSGRPNAGRPARRYERDKDGNLVRVD